MDDFFNAWDGIVLIPFSSRVQKPRSTGLTMVMDKGLGISETEEMLSLAGRYIDYVKLAFGTSALYNESLLREKISLVRSRGVHIYPGGTFLEIAILQNKTEDFLNRAWNLGFSAIEVSDGTIPLSADARRNVIKIARGMGFEVISEVGKKDPNDNLVINVIINQIKADLDSGVSKVILEARESGKGIGIFDKKGEIIRDQFKELISNISDPDIIIWEAPLKIQQQELITYFGPNVNLGNIPPAEILALESLRVGLRSDTLKTLIPAAKS